MSRLGGADFRIAAAKRPQRRARDNAPMHRMRERNGIVADNGFGRLGSLCNCRLANGPIIDKCPVACPPLRQLRPEPLDTRR